MLGTSTKPLQGTIPREGGESSSGIGAAGVVARTSVALTLTVASSPVQWDLLICCYWQTRLLAE